MDKKSGENKISVAAGTSRRDPEPVDEIRAGEGVFPEEDEPDFDFDFLERDTEEEEESWDAENPEEEEDLLDVGDPEEEEDLLDAENPERERHPEKRKQPEDKKARSAGESRTDKEEEEEEEPLLSAPDDGEDDFDLDVTDADIRAYDLLDGEDAPVREEHSAPAEEPADPGIEFLWGNPDRTEKKPGEDREPAAQETAHTDRERKKKKNRHRAQFLLVLVPILAAAAVLLAAAGTQVLRNIACRQADAEYASYIPSYIRLEDTDTSSDTHSIPAAEIDYDGLAAINGDFAGVISIPALDAVWPFTAGEDATYASTHTFSGTRNPEGSVFLAKDSAEGLNTVMYGNEAPGGRLFGKLLRYQRDAALAMNDPYIYIYTPTERRKYRIMGWYRVMNNDPVLRQFTSDRRYEYYVSLVRSRTTFNAGDLDVWYDHEAPFLTLATYESGSRSYCFVVSAILTHTEEAEDGG